jgi:ligand-binding sensor domain-containing protein
MGQLGIALSAGIAILALLLTALSFRKAARGLDAARSSVAHQNEIIFRRSVLDKTIVSMFDPVSAPAQFRDAAFFAGHLYICGPSGLLSYDTAGALAARFVVGRELPPAPCVAVASGLAAGTAQEQLWIATAGEGLLAYDGARFTHIRAEEESARHLTAVLPMSSGRILLGTDKRGVLAWDGQALTVLHPSLAGLAVTALAGTESDLWIGTMDQGVLRWHAGQLDRFGEKEGLPDVRVLSLVAQTGSAFAGTALGVVEFREGKLYRRLADGYFAQTLLLHDGMLRIGTLEEGILDVPISAAKQPRPRVAHDEADLGPVRRLLEMNGNTYALTASGLWMENQGYHPVLQPPGSVLTDGNVAALAADRTGRLWVGLFDRGIDILEADASHSTHIETPVVFCVNRIVHSSDGDLTAVGTANGLVLFDGGGHQRQVLTKASGLIANNVTDVLLRGDSHSLSMVVATPAGITTIAPVGTSSIYGFHGLVNNHVFALAASGTRVLAGTLGGLSILDAGLVTASFTTANSGLKQNWITAIVPVSNEWFAGTYGGAVVKLDAQGRWSGFEDFRPPAEINQGAMLVTDRAVYAGTLRQGLAVYSRASGRWNLIERGLPSRNVTALAARQGVLYVGTDNGLVQAAESRLLP